MFELAQNNIDIEDQQTAVTKENVSMLSINPRLGFIRKVYGILTYQLSITVVMCIISMSCPGYFEFQRENRSITLIAAIFTMISSITLICCKHIARTVPLNYIILTAYTICEGYMVSMICAYSDPQIVLMAAIMTLGVTISLTVYAMTTKTDVTYFGSFLFIILSSLIIGLIFTIFIDINGLYIGGSLIGVILYGFYLVYDTQIIIGGHYIELSYDDYIVGSILIYVDVIVLFLRILEILNRLKK